MEDDFADVPVAVPAAFWEALARDERERAGEILRESAALFDASGRFTPVGTRVAHYRESDRGSISRPEIAHVAIAPEKREGTALLLFDEFVSRTCCVGERSVRHRETLAVKIDPPARKVHLRMQEWRIQFSEE